MVKSFDEAYASYLASLAKLDEIEDITEKNMLFRQLAELLAEMESDLKSNSTSSVGDKSNDEQSELTHWI
jgi:hypothetical protein